MKKYKSTTLSVLQKMLKLDDQAALSQTYDFYVAEIFRNYPEMTAAAWMYGRDVLARVNTTVKDLDVTKVFDNSFVQSAKDRKVGG